MKTRTILLAIASLLSAIAVEAQSVDGARIDSLRIERNGDRIAVDMGIDLSDMHVESNRAILITPLLVNGADTLSLSSIGLYGRRRYFYYVRNDRSLLSSDGTSYKWSDKPDTVAYHAELPYREWFNGADLVMHREDYGCCNTLLAEQTGRVGRYEEVIPVPVEPYLPTLAYVRPMADGDKHYSLSGSAFIDFPVDQTVIYPDYRRNTVELAKIHATIDSVRNDRDITITSVWLKGYASPESPYAHNTDLAKGRTAALKSHIQQLYRFEPGVIVTEYEPEDWEGLRLYVDRSNLAHREQILALIDSDLDPDVKEWRIKRSYPADYRFLLQNCYPALRHTDYRIDYKVRMFSDVEEIKRVMRTQPQKLGLDEFYLAASSCESGSDEFNEIFETAVRMFPDDAVANLNAANTALQRGDMSAAERYLSKSGDLAEAVYTRGVVHLMNKRYDQAEVCMLQAREQGVGQAEEALAQIAVLKQNIEK